MENIREKLDSHFGDLVFNEEAHTYRVGDKFYPSVSGLIKKYCKPFPKDAAKNVAARDGKTEEQVKAEWKAISDEACDRGTRVHLYGEEYPFDRTLKPDGKPGSIEYRQKVAVKKFWDDMPEHIIPVKMEQRMYHKVFDYAGTADILLYDKKNDTIIIADYKTNKDLFKNFRGQTLLGPFKSLLDCPFNKYQLQLSFYQILLEQTGLKISGRKLIGLSHDGDYDMYDLDDLTGILRQQLAA